MENSANTQKKVKLAIILLIILAVATIVVSCVGAVLTRMPEVSGDNPFGDGDVVVEERNVFVRFWNNLVGFFTGDTGEEVPGNEEVLPSMGDDEIEETDFQRKKGFYNFLLIAKDKGGNNTDVMMILSFDIENDKIAILQLPRDTYMNTKYSFKKLNSIYAAGYSEAVRDGKESDERQKFGIDALCDVILDNFGIVIDRYVFVDIEGFKYIVDAIDGVDVYVQSDMYYYDDYQDLQITLKKGQHHLDGEKAEGFVRFRSGYIDADLGRMDAQKIFMSAFLDKLFSVSSITKIPDLAGQVMKYLDTDISLADAIVFAKQLFEVDMSQITMHTLQGEALYYESVAYFSAYEKINLDLVNKYFNAFDKDLEEEHVNVVVLGDEPDDSEYHGGNSAENINDENPKLNFWG